MLSQRPVDLDRDREFVLDLSCLASYETQSSWYRSNSYRAYREVWAGSALPGIFLDKLSASLQDSRTVAEIWEEDGQHAGFLWLAFEDIHLGRLIATVHSLVVAPGFQRRGIGSMMLQQGTRLARENNAGILRVETSVENPASQAICAKEGYTVAGLLYEKVLDEGQR